MEDDSHLCRNRRIPGIITARARNLRSEQTPSEKYLWELLRDNNFGLKFRRQHSIGHLILDFYCPKLRLGIELDGSIHHEINVRVKDDVKTEFVTGQGVTLLRFTNDELFENPGKVLDRILAVALRLKGK